MPTVFIVIFHINYHVRCKNDYFFIDRELEGYETFLVILNVGSEEEIITLSEHFNSIPPYMVVRISSINSYYIEQ